MTRKQFDALVAQFGKQAAVKIKKMGDELEKKLNQRAQEVIKGNMKQSDFDAFKKEELKKLNDRLAETEKLIDTVQKQGTKIGELETMITEGKTKGKKISLDEFLKGLLPKIKEQRTAGAGHFEVSSQEMLDAGVIFGGPRAAEKINKAPAIQTVGTTLDPMDAAPGQPYAPGLGGADLELFEIIRNPNFILNRVDVGRTNQARLAWINETLMEGVVGVNIGEGAEKPLIWHKFKVEYSVAKKAGARIELTEEFEEDLPGLATAIRRMLQNDVLRAFDDAIQLAVIAIARPYEIVGFDAQVEFATFFDAMGALLAQVGFNNFVPNTLALNPVTSWLSMMGKDQHGAYLNPPFMQRLTNILIEANKVAVGQGLAGDLSQFKVDIYKDFTLRIGWYNDQFIKNEFSILGELRYHAYISDARKKAIVYDDLTDIRNTINAPAA
jgi:hypothetical protein